MEENNNIEQSVENNEHKTEENKNICFKNHCWKMCLGMVIAAFLGGFLATYFVADQMSERVYAFDKNKISMNEPSYTRELPENDVFKDIEKIHQEHLKEFENFEKNFNKLQMPIIPNIDMNTAFTNEVKIKSEIDNNNFEVEVGLKPFNNDESKVNYNLHGRKLTVFGSSEVKDDKYEETVSFTQDFILPKNADLAKISKKKDGDKLIISIPLK